MLSDIDGLFDKNPAVHADAKLRSHVADMPAYSVGFVYLPAFIGIVCASVVTSRFGARAANRLPVSVLKKAFGAFLCFVAGGVVGGVCGVVAGRAFRLRRGRPKIAAACAW